MTKRKSSAQKFAKKAIKQATRNSSRKNSGQSCRATCIQLGLGTILGVMALIYLVTTVSNEESSRAVRSTNTPRATLQSQSINGVEATTQPMPTASATLEIMYSQTRASVRSCPRLDCEVVTIIGSGETISIIESVEGDVVVSGNDQWYRVFIDGRVAYMYSTTLADVRPGIIQATPPSNSLAPQNTRVPSRRPADCEEAVEMGLTAEQAAQWPHLDRDNDGVACYGD